MRKVIGGNGSDTTSTVKAYLASGREMMLANLYLFGDPENSKSLWLTDWEGPLCWPVWSSQKVSPNLVNAFDSAVIKRESVTSSVGLEVSTLGVTWSPANSAWSANVSSANAYQLAQMGYYDNWTARVWTAYMPTAGDANTYGASELFGGRISDCVVQRGQIRFTINSFLDCVNEYVPTNVIEVLNTLAAYTGATPPSGEPSIPIFNVIGGGATTNTQLLLDEISPTPHHIYTTNRVQQGFVVFLAGTGATLAGVWSSIQSNHQYTVNGTNYNLVQLYSPLPWPPTPGVDKCYISAAAPINRADGDYYGFPYVPSPYQSQ